MIALTISEATEIVGGLTKTSKMPGSSYSTPAPACITGSKLHLVPDSVCEKCYAWNRGMYGFPVVQNAQARRLARQSDPRWVQAMVSLTAKQKHFRWFDSGDLQSLSMLIKMVAVAMLNPQTTYWLPTKEYKFVTEYRKRGGVEPANFILRPSAPMINQRLPKAWGNSSMVIRHGFVVDNDVFVCDASHTMKNGQKVKTITKENKALLGHCGDCRECWNPSNKVTAYPIH
jgi:hypothetical protein